jgi:hypothetical protein
MSEKCYFTNLPVTSVIKNRAGDMIEILGSPCGDYVLVEPLLINEANGKNSQRLLRCASVNKVAHGDGYRSVWLPSSKYNDSEYINGLQEKLINQGKHKFFSFENEYLGPIKHEEKPYLLLRSLARKVQDSSGYERVYVNDSDKVEAMLMRDEFENVARHLEKIGLIEEFIPKSVSGPRLKITPKGWESVREKISKKSNRVFIAMAFNWNEKENNGKTGQSDTEIEFLTTISKVCRELGYEASPVSQDHNGNFVYKILNELENSAFVIADFTHHSKGVYFEAGYARAKGKEVFHLIHEEHKNEIHSDIKQIQYLPWKEMKTLETQLMAKIQVIIGKYKEQ